MKYRHIILAVLGILLGLLGFLISNEKEIPVVSNLLFKDIYNLEYGFNKVCGLPIKIVEESNRYRRLKKGDLQLNPGDRGFKELSAYILKDLKRRSSRHFAKTGSGNMSFAEFKEKALKYGFSSMRYSGIPGDRHGINVPYGNNKVQVFLNNSQNEYASFFVYTLKRGIEREYIFKRFSYSLLLYFIGLFIQIFQIEWKKR